MMMLEKSDDPRLYQLHAEICKTLASPKRLAVIRHLSAGELPVSVLASRLGISRANLSQHLALMRQRGVLATRREGTTIYYRIANPKIVAACALMREVLQEILVEGEELGISLRTGAARPRGARGRGR